MRNIKDYFKSMLKSIITAFWIVCMVFFIASGCGDSKSDPESNDEELTELPEGNEEELTSLTGTSWKLAEIVDAETGALKELEPTETTCIKQYESRSRCFMCYTIEFEDIISDHYCSENSLSTFFTYTPGNDLSACYLVDYDVNYIQIINVGGTKAGDTEDGIFWKDFLPGEYSFSFEQGQLKLYREKGYLKDYEDNYCLIFKRLNREK